MTSAQNINEWDASKLLDHLDVLLASDLPEELFRTVYMHPIKFFITPQRNIEEGQVWKKMKLIIQKCYGELHVSTQASEGHNIKLVHKKCARNDTGDLFLSSYILDCISQEKLLDINQYRANKCHHEDCDPMSVMQGRITWEFLETKRDSGDEIEDFSNEEDDDQATSTSTNYNIRRGFKGYSFDEEKKILDYIIKNQYFYKVRGNEIWKRMENNKVCNQRTWQSMKQRYLRYIIPNINMFKLDNLTKLKVLNKDEPVMTSSAPRMTDEGSHQKNNNDEEERQENSKKDHHDSIRLAPSPKRTGSIASNACQTSDIVRSSDDADSELWVVRNAEEKVQEKIDTPGSNSDSNDIKIRLHRISPRKKVQKQSAKQDETNKSIENNQNNLNNNLSTISEETEKNNCVENEKSFTSPVSPNKKYNLRKSQHCNENESSRTTDSHTNNVTESHSISVQNNENIENISSLSEEIVKVGGNKNEPNSSSSRISPYKLRNVQALNKREAFGTTDEDESNGTSDSRIKNDSIYVESSVSSSDSSSDDEDSSSSCVILHRSKYSKRDDQAILKYIRKRNAFHLVGGVSVWKAMEEKEIIPGRSWQSLKERYRMRIRGRLTKYGDASSEKKNRLKKRIRLSEDVSDSDTSIAPLDNKNLTPMKSIEARRNNLYYRTEEDEAIVDYIINHNGYGRVKGRRLWVEMSNTALKSRTWESLKNRFQKSIFLTLKTFPITKEQIQKIRDGYWGKLNEESPVIANLYDRFEDEAILDFIITNKRYRDVKGNLLWIHMTSHPSLRQRTWQSLKNRFLKYISQNLENFDLEEDQVECFRNPRSKASWKCVSGGSKNFQNAARKRVKNTPTKIEPKNHISSNTENTESDGSPDRSKTQISKSKSTRSRYEDEFPVKQNGHTSRARTTSTESSDRDVVSSPKWVPKNQITEAGSPRELRSQSKSDVSKSKGGKGVKKLFSFTGNLFENTPTNVMNKPSTRLKSKFDRPKSLSVKLGQTTNDEGNTESEEEKNREESSSSSNKSTSILQENKESMIPEVSSPREGRTVRSDSFSIKSSVSGRRVSPSPRSSLRRSRSVSPERSTVKSERSVSPVRPSIKIERSVSPSVNSSLSSLRSASHSPSKKRSKLMVKRLSCSLTSREDSLSENISGKKIVSMSVPGEGESSNNFNFLIENASSRTNMLRNFRKDSKILARQLNLTTPLLRTNIRRRKVNITKYI